MNFRHTEEEEIFSKGVGDFLAAESPPKNVREWESDPVGFSKDLLKRMAEQGWMGIHLPSEVGGLGLPFDYLTILFHQLGRHLTPGPLWETIVGGLMLQETAKSGYKGAFLSRLAKGELLSTLTLHPPALTCRGRCPVASGELRFVPYAAGSDLVIALAKGKKPMLAVLQTQSARIKVEPVPVTSGERLAHVRVNHATLEAGMAFPISLRAYAAVIERSYVLSAAYLLGISEKALETATEYAKQRVQFGRPIGSFQAVQHLVADIRVKVEGLRLIVYEASWAVSTGRPASKLTSMAKYWANSTAYTATKNAHQVLGGFGVMAETDLQLYYRRAKGWMINKGGDLDMLDRVAENL